jgi:hypothetical protein
MVDDTSQFVLLGADNSGKTQISYVDVARDRANSRIETAPFKLSSEMADASFDMQSKLLAWIGYDGSEILVFRQKLQYPLTTLRARDIDPSGKKRFVSFSWSAAAKLVLVLQDPALPALENAEYFTASGPTWTLRRISQSTIESRRFTDHLRRARIAYRDAQVRDLLPAWPEQGDAPRIEDVFGLLRGSAVGAVRPDGSYAIESRLGEDFSFVNSKGRVQMIKRHQRPQVQQVRLLEHFLLLATSGDSIEVWRLEDQKLVSVLRGSGIVTMENT